MPLFKDEESGFCYFDTMDEFFHACKEGPNVYNRNYKRVRYIQDTTCPVCSKSIPKGFLPYYEIRGYFTWYGPPGRSEEEYELDERPTDYPVQTLSLTEKGKAELDKRRRRKKFTVVK